MYDYEHLRELIPAYSIGATDEDETRMVEAGLIDFPELIDDLRAFEQMNMAMAEAVPAMTPPTGMLDNILAAARQNPPAPVVPEKSPALKVLPRLTRRAIPWRTVAASLALFLVLTNAFWLYRATQPTVQEIRLWDATDAAANPLRCRIVVFPNTPSAVMIAQNFPILEEGRVYQMWMRRDGEVVSLGVFDVDGQGSGFLTFPADMLTSSFESIGVTIEPLGGSVEPTTPSVVRWQSI